MTRRVNMVLAMTTAFGLCSVYALAPLGNGDDAPQSGSKAAPLAQAEAGRPARTHALELATSGDEGSSSGADALVAAPPDPSSPLELFVDAGARVRQRYAELFRELDLSEPETEALVPILVEQSQREHASSSHDPLDAERNAERERAAISAVIGPEKTSQFGRLKKTLPARVQLEFARQQLETSGMPLGEAQRERILALMSAQEPMPPWDRIESESSEEQFARYRRWQQQRTERFIEQAAPALTPAQKRHLEDHASMHAAVTPLRSGELGAAGSPALRSPTD